MQRTLSCLLIVCDEAAEMCFLQDAEARRSFGSSWGSRDLASAPPRIYDATCRSVYTSQLHPGPVFTQRPAVGCI